MRPSDQKWLALSIALGLIGVALVLGSVLENNSAPLTVPAAPTIQSGSAPQYLFSLNKPDGLLRPMAVTTNAAGDIFVADTGHALIQVFDRAGQYQRSIGRVATRRPLGDGELLYPVGLAVNDAGQLLVADVQAGRISIFQADGQFAGIVGAGVITSPIGLVYRNGQLFVNDISQQQVVVLDNAGHVVTRYGATADLAYANYSAVSTDGSIAVGDSNNNRVVVFTAAGQISATLKVAGADSLAMPRGLAYDPLGRLHIASAFAHQVFVFDPALNFLYAYGQRGSADGQFNFPNGLWISASRAYVADRENNRVQVWQLADIP